MPLRSCKGRSPGRRDLCSSAVFHEEYSRRDRNNPKHFGVSDIPIAALEHVPQEYLRGLADTVHQCEGAV